MSYSLLIGFAIVLIIIALINTVMPKINYYIANKNKLKHLQYGITSRQDLFDLESRTVSKLMKNLIGYEGYSHIEGGSSQGKNDIKYIAMLHDEKVYINYEIVDTQYKIGKDKKVQKITEEKDIPKIGRPEIQKLLGRMAHDEVRHGIYITNGSFSDEAKSFAENINEDYDIILYDGIRLTKEIADLKNNYNPKGELVYG